MSVYRAAFWRAAGERMVRGAGIGGLIYLGAQFSDVIQTGAFNAFDLTWGIVGYILGGALVSLLFSLAGNAASGNGPSFNQTEVIVAPPVDQAPAGVTYTPDGTDVVADPQPEFVDGALSRPRRVEDIPPH
jgi:hypothetical protein